MPVSQSLFEYLHCKARNTIIPYHKVPDSGGEWRFSDRRPTTRSVWREGGNCSDETVGPMVDWRGLETVAYLARNWRFQSIPLQRGVRYDLDLGEALCR